MKQSRCNGVPRHAAGPWRGRRWLPAAIAFILTHAVFAGRLDAWQSPGSAGRIESSAECCLVLLLPVGARSASVGGALTAATGVDAVFINPAGLAALGANHFIIHQNSMSADATAFSFLLAPRGAGTLGLSYQLHDIGDIENTDEHGRTIGSLAIRHHLLVASYGVPVHGGLSAGMNYKLYQFRIGCSGACAGEEVAATTHAVDVGIHFRPSRYPALQLGAALVNTGFALQVVNAQQADPLPRRLRAGVLYDLLWHLPFSKAYALWLATEMTAVPDRSEAIQPAVGIEFSAHDAVFLRMGYVSGTGVGTGTSMGIGMRHSRFDMAVAKSFVSSRLDLFDEPIQFTFGVAF